MKEWNVSEEKYEEDEEKGCKKQYRHVVKRAMNILQRQDRTEKQLRDKLERDRCFSEEEIDYAVNYVIAFRYVDDLRYARNYVRFRSYSKSKQQLLFGLLGKGVSKDLIQVALEEDYEGEETVLIYHFLEKKGYFQEPFTPKEREKLIASLMRKGFSYDDISRTMNRD